MPSDIVTVIPKGNRTDDETEIENTSFFPNIGIKDFRESMRDYKQSVFNEAKADLTERFRDFDSTKSGHKEADKLEIGINDYRQKSREHIRALLGTNRAIIGLI